MSSLQVTQHEPRTVEWWFEQFKADHLELNPDFQRRSNLWSNYKQAHLIDSIINGYDLPKFYVADFTMGRSPLNTAHRPYAVVDGKQRFGAIFAFLRNQLKLNKSSTFDADPALLVRGLTFEQLKVECPSLAAKILSFKPVVMSIVTEDRAKISEMFVRLNSGEAANSAERRNAQPGPIPTLVRELVEHAFFRDRVSFSKKRMADHQVAAKLLLIEHRDGVVDTKAQDIDRFVQRAAEETTPPQFEPNSAANEAALKVYDAASDRVIVVLERLAEAFRSHDPLLSASSRIPVYYLVLRNHPEVTQNFRDFVEEFESRVIDAMRAARDRDETPDQAYLNYYTLSRTSNDQKSVRGRYQMMVAELRKRHLVD